MLKQIHDDLDAAVFAAYGWPATLTDEEILERLVALNTERHAEEQRGIVRWLRPEFQTRNLPAAGNASKQTSLDLEETPDEVSVATLKPTKIAKTPWPKLQAERTKAVQTALAAATLPVTPQDLAQTFLRARADSIEEILLALVSLGLARRLRGGKYAAA